FEYEGEVGAAVCVHVDGDKVVDLWGGVADRDTGRPYTADTLQVIFSSTKGAVAICANMLIERRLIDVDAPVAIYWPAFGAAGQTAGQWFAAEVAAPLGLDCWIGLPASEEARVSPMIDAPMPDDPAIAELMQQMMGPESELFRVVTVDGALPAAAPGKPMLFN